MPLGATPVSKYDWYQPVTFVKQCTHDTKGRRDAGVAGNENVVGVDFAVTPALAAVYLNKLKDQNKRRSSNA